MDGVDDLGAINSLQVNAGDPEIAMRELPLDHDQRDAFVRHLDSVRMPQLMRRHPAANPGVGGGPLELFAGGGGFPAPAGCRSVDHAQQRAGREAGADLHPRLEAGLGPTVQSDFPPLPALPPADRDLAVRAVEIGLGEVECLADP
jgi:hypothetical protein